MGIVSPSRAIFSCWGDPGPTASLCSGVASRVGHPVARSPVVARDGDGLGIGDVVEPGMAEANSSGWETRPIRAA